MTDAERDEYQRRVRELAAEYRAQRPRTSFAQKVARELSAGRDRVMRILGREPSLAVAPKGTRRTSGPYLVTTGPRCAECREPVIAGEATLFPPRGLCGKCQQHAQGNAMQATDDDPRAA